MKFPKGHFGKNNYNKFKSLIKIYLLFLLLNIAPNETKSPPTHVNGVRTLDLLYEPKQFYKLT